MKAVLLAGGYGSRLSEETDRRPKPMVEVGGRPLLWHICKIYAHHGITEFVVALGYRGYVIKEYFANFFLHSADVTLDLSSGEMEVHQAASESWKVTLVDTGLETQTGGRLQRVRPFLGDETFCMTYGDGVADVDVAAAIAFHRRHGAAATVTAIAPPGRFGVLEVDGDQVRGFCEKPGGDSWINGGFFVLEPRALDVVDGPEVAWEREPLQRLAEADELRCYRHTGYWQPMDTLRDRRALEQLWSSGVAPWKVW